MIMGTYILPRRLPTLPAKEEYTLWAKKKAKGPHRSNTAINRVPLMTILPDHPIYTFALYGY